jgi:hypothetical protein
MKADTTTTEPDVLRQQTIPQQRTKASFLNHHDPRVQNHLSSFVSMLPLWDLQKPKIRRTPAQAKVTWQIESVRSNPTFNSESEKKFRGENMKRACIQSPQSRIQMERFWTHLRTDDHIAQSRRWFLFYDGHFFAQNPLVFPSTYQRSCWTPTLWRTSILTTQALEHTSVLAFWVLGGHQMDPATIRAWQEHLGSISSWLL